MGKSQKYNKHHQQEPRGQSFPSRTGEHKAAMNRRKSMGNTIHKNTNDPQKKFRLGTVSKNILLAGLNWFHGANLTLRSDVDQDT